jgi:hypothetical protein
VTTFPPFSPSFACFRKAKGHPAGPCPMYPFRTRTKWILANRYHHILRAFRDRPAPDTLVQERLESMRRWNRVFIAVGFLLYVGIGASLAGVVATVIPALEEPTQAFQSVVSVTSAFTGALTLAYLFLARLLGQIETDIWVVLALK